LGKRPPINTATRRFCSRCCARAASGNAVETEIPLMKSRRRIASSKAQDYANDDHYSKDLRKEKWGSMVNLRRKNPQPRVSQMGQS